jgi:hypothetical protein
MRVRTKVNSCTLRMGYGLNCGEVGQTFTHDRPLLDARPNLDRPEALPTNPKLLRPGSRKTSGAGRCIDQRSRPLETPPLALRAV